MRRVQEYLLSDLQEFPNISDDRIDNIIKDFIHVMVLPLVSRSCQATFNLLFCMWKETKLEWQ